jgi:hypothetical protein
MPFTLEDLLPDDQRLRTVQLRGKGGTTMNGQQERDPDESR